MLSYTDIQEILRIPLLGIIPESESVLHASNAGNPAIHIDGSEVSEAYKDVIARFLGEDKPLRFIDYEKPGLLQRRFGRSEERRVGKEWGSKCSYRWWPW